MLYAELMTISVVLIPEGFEGLVASLGDICGVVERNWELEFIEAQRPEAFRGGGAREALAGAPTSRPQGDGLFSPF